MMTQKSPISSTQSFFPDDHEQKFNNSGYPSYSAVPNTACSPSSVTSTSSIQMDCQSSLGVDVPQSPTSNQQPIASHDVKVQRFPSRESSSDNVSVKSAKGYNECAIDPVFFTDPTMVKPSGPNTITPSNYFIPPMNYDRNGMPHVEDFGYPQNDYTHMTGRFMPAYSNGNGSLSRSPLFQQNTPTRPPPAPQSSMISVYSSRISVNPLRKYKCDYCQKLFVRPSQLKTHTYTHTGEKPFQCDVDGCGRCFSVISNLHRHQKIHAKINPSS